MDIVIESSRLVCEKLDRLSGRKNKKFFWKHKRNTLDKLSFWYENEALKLAKKLSKRALENILKNLIQTGQKNPYL